MERNIYKVGEGLVVMDKKGIGILSIVLIIAVAVAVGTSLYVTFSGTTLQLAPRGPSLDAGGGNITHLECINNTCTVVQGSGNNTCDFRGQACGGNQTLPDLIIVNLTIDVQLIEGNGTGNETNETFYRATVFVTVKNIGDASTGTSFKTEIDVSSFSPRNIFTSALGINEETTIIDVYSPIDEGIYNVTSFADILFQIGESNESNNAFGPVFFTVP